MKEELKIQLKDFKKQYSSYKEYLEETDWTEDYDIEDSYKTEASIIDNIMRDIRNFSKENESSLHLKEVQKFFKYCNEIVEIHIKRIEKYLEQNDWKKAYKDERDEIIGKMKKLEEEGLDEVTKILYEDYKRTLSDIESNKRKEIKFQNDIFTQGREIRVKSLSLNINVENNTLSPHLFHANKKASLIMRSFLYDKEPYLREKTDLLKINWESPNPATSKELYINMDPKDIPPYDPNKHFFEQSVDVIQFWEEEINKIKYGINFGGYHLSGFVYTGINYCNIPQGAGLEKRVAPVLLTDNIYYIDETLKEAVRLDKEAVMLYGSRRVSKSVSESMYLTHALLSIYNCSAALTGFSEKDLGHVGTYLDITFNNLPPALKPNINVNSDKEFNIGIKGRSAQDNYNMATLAIVNLDGGTKKNSTQKLAGFTPDAVVVDEGAKGNLIDPWLALRPALSGGKGGTRRTVALIAATSGEEALSKYAEKMIKNPKAYGVLPANWDLLDSIADPEYITWKRGTFCTFMPAQMSLEGKKDETTLDKFLKIDNPELSKIKILKTDWKHGKEKFEKRRKEVESDYTAQASEISSFPLDPDDVYLSGTRNKFNAIGMKKHQNWLIENEQTGAKYWFTQNIEGQIELTLTNEPIITQYPYGGGSFNAPVQVFERVEEEPPFGLYVMGLDDVKHDQSDGDSVISCTVYKRNWELSEWADRIVCTYATRPDRKEEAYKVIRLIMKYYNAIVFPENEDEGFKDFLERRHKLEALKHLAEGVDFSRSLNLDHNNNRAIGFSATIKNINRLNSRVLAYTQDPIEEEGELDGYVMINDVMLLEEMIHNKPGANADRIRSFGLALLYAEYLDKNNLYISRRRWNTQPQDGVKRKRVTKHTGLINKKFNIRRRGF